MNVDYIIVGLGLAGLAFSEELVRANKSFIVYEDHSQTSSKVAGGVYNPVILKRYTPVWKAKEQLEVAMPFYQQLEAKLNERFDQRFVIKKCFKSIEDQNNWFTALDKPKLSPFMDPELDTNYYSGIVSSYHYGNVNEGGRVDTEKLVDHYRRYLKAKERIRFEKMDYNLLKFNGQFMNYQDIRAKSVVFCEGYGVKKNPFFKNLPLTGTKGELITIHAPKLDIDFLLKSTLFVLPIGNHYYKIGATFNNRDKTSIPSEEGKSELIEKLDKVINVSYSIVNHTAGVRPTVKDRRPLVGVHPEHRNLALLNGFGSRGVMTAPWAAKQLFNHLENGDELDPEMDIKRFSSH